jgi:purine-nucleoside phosphorylase
VLPVSLAHGLGAKTLFVSNACGGLNPAWEAGDIMLQNDFINFTGTNPLLGPNDSSIGPRFLPLMGGYDKDLAKIAREAARACDLQLREGVYLGITGPMYAPKAELRMYRQWGADAIGMSTVLEIIQALYLGMRVLGLSSVTDMAVADREDHSETNEQAVIEQAQKTGPNFRKLVKSIIRRMG